MAEAIAFDIAAGLITKLASLALSQFGLCWNFKDDLNDLKRTVIRIQAVLLDAEEKSVISNLVKVWLQELKDALYDAEDLLDDVHTEALRKDLMSGNKLLKEVRVFFSSTNQFAYSRKMGRKIKAIKARFTSIQSQTSELNLVQRDHPLETHLMVKRRQQTHSFVPKDEIIGRDNDKAALLKLLLNIESQNEENVYFIPIVGIGGMVANIIKSVTNQAPDQTLEMDQLQKQLRDKIDGKRYLLVLDDIWNEDGEEWNNLKKLLMGGARGSKIIVTTRSRTVAKITSKCEPYVLKGLSDDDAWSLFQKIAFDQRSVDSRKPTFLIIGKQILGRCVGVPLAIRSIASTLSIKETEDEWSFFKDNVFARIVQKDGFVKQSNPSLPLEEIGLEYFKDLVERSFFQDVQDDADRETSKMHDILDDFLEERGTCKMHDLMHDLAESVAGKESDILYSNLNAREVDENCRHLSVDFSSNPLFKPNKLRTLLCFWDKRYHTVSEATWDSIISNCRCLRVLQLHKSDIDTIPHSIHKLKHLRYLDLSNIGDLKILPKSVCKIQNLQVLKLRGCMDLEELPKKIEKLVNLTHLPCEGCWSLTHMPRGIGKLTLLQTLSLFVVDKGGSHGAAAADLSELGGLNNLRGELRIKNLGWVKNAKIEFGAAKLKEKQHLRSLVLEWSGDNDDEDKSLEDLQPHPNLKELKVIGWRRGDVKFPSWSSLLTYLTAIEIRDCNAFKYLPSFAGLAHLQRLWIEGLTKLEYMEDSEPGGERGESESFFPSLTSLTLIKCPNMKSWWRNNNDDNGTEIRASTMRFLCLSSLHIEYCPLTSMPLYPSLDDELTLINTSSRPLKQSIQMNIATSTSSLPLSKLKSFHVDTIEADERQLNKSLSGWLQQLTSLRGLKISNCKELDLEGIQWETLKNLSDLEISDIPQLVSLPLSLQHLVQLKRLVIRNCSGFKSLFPVFQHLTSLETLKIFNCKELDLSAAGIQILQDYTSLRSLHLDNIPKCWHLPVWLQRLTNLQTLYLSNMSNLTSLPDEMASLTSLEGLSIRQSPQVEERCRKDIGADWHKIAHIQIIWANGTLVQDLQWGRHPFSCLEFQPSFLLRLQNIGSITDDAGPVLNLHWKNIRNGFVVGCRWCTE
ncbi:hypothetical protein V6N11_016485 [Hibiscus sabdariffa]|uniref:Uncharacterized protein n=1 Tax=Hibiscus sabdariffa TaxID=183260 RepID=A0ABR2TVD5_9ROSI